jgi:hypothetical protein
MDWKTMLAYVTGSVDENLMLRIEYLVAENLILRDQIKGRVQLSDAERQTLAEIGAKLGKQARKRGKRSWRPRSPHSKSCWRPMGWRSNRRCSTKSASSSPAWPR